MTASGKILKLLALVLVACLPSPVGALAQAGVQVPKEADANVLPYKYTGNLYSRKFHRPRCPYSRVMAETKRVRFHFRCQAVAQGYVPCRYCLPPVWTTVTATIKYQDLNKMSPQNDQTETLPADQTR